MTWGEGQWGLARANETAHLVDEFRVLGVVDVSREGDVVDRSRKIRSAREPLEVYGEDTQSSRDLGSSLQRLNLCWLVHDRLHSRIR